MSEMVAGHCLHLYLQNYALIDSLEEQESLPVEFKEEEQLFSAFGQRARDQASGLLELLYAQAIAAGALPYRCLRRSQRRTVREQWRMDGNLLLPREKMSRNYWSLYLGALRDKGPAACLVLGPMESDSTVALDAVGTSAAQVLGLATANARIAFSHDSDYQSGIIVGFSALSPSSTYQEIGDAVKEQMDRFFSRYRAQLDEALRSA